jgi:hypothetical protein
VTKTAPPAVRSAPRSAARPTAPARSSKGAAGAPRKAAARGRSPRR